MGAGQKADHSANVAEEVVGGAGGAARFVAVGAVAGTGGACIGHVVLP